MSSAQRPSAPRRYDGTMDNTGDLRLLLASRHPLVIAETRDERRFLEILRDVAGSLDLPIWIWSVARGLARDENPPQMRTLDPKAALDHIATLPGPGVFVFADAHRHLEDAVFVRKLKELAHAAAPQPRTIVLAVPDHRLPRELDGTALPWTLRPPGREELDLLLRRTLEDLAERSISVRLTAEEHGRLVDSLRGLSVTEAERLIQRAALRDGRVDSEDVAFVRGAKAELLAAGGVLELIEADHGTLEAVGGMERLKEWLRLRGRGMEAEARAFGIDAPRGVLLTGVPGCGKSLAAKVLARTWDLPLVLLDPARLYGSFVGESEQRLRDALHTLEAMAPIVVWIDEMEKAFDTGRAADGGVSRRILGTFLRWMQERPEGIFLVATSNDVEAMPPELLRKGRFDEIFFVDLPDAREREEIVRIHLASRGRDPEAFDLARLAAASEGFSGADLEAAVVGALYRAYGANGELTLDLLADELGRTVPLSRSRPEDVAALRAWAAERAISA